MFSLAGILMLLTALHDEKHSRCPRASWAALGYWPAIAHQPLHRTPVELQLLALEKRRTMQSSSQSLCEFKITNELRCH